MLKKRTGRTVNEVMKGITDQYGSDVIIVSTNEKMNEVEVIFTLGDEGAIKNNIKEADSQQERDQEEMNAQTIDHRQLMSFGKEREATTPAQVQNDLSQNGQLDQISQHFAKEIEKIKNLIQAQYNTMNWQSFASGNETKGQIWQDLIDAGFSPVVARTVTEAMPSDLTGQEASAWVVEAMTAQIERNQKDKNLIEDGGVFAMVGPTGSGKTTTIAKIAARCIIEKGKNSVALITTDTYRIGAIDQLRTYGRVLGVPVYVCLNDEELRAQLRALKDKHLVLIDTMGLSPRDARTVEHAGIFDDLGINKIFVMNVAAQGRALSEAGERFKGQGFYGAILTKLDECSQIAGALDVALRQKLNLIFMSTGQRVPEDMYAADSHFLIKRAIRNQYEKAYAKTEQESMWSRFGAVSHGARETRGKNGK